jgi:hypothetical protein
MVLGEKIPTPEILVTHKKIEKIFFVWLQFSISRILKIFFWIGRSPNFSSFGSPPVVADFWFNNTGNKKIEGN